MKPPHQKTCGCKNKKKDEGQAYRAKNMMDKRCYVQKEMIDHFEPIWRNAGDNEYHKCGQNCPGLKKRCVPPYPKWYTEQQGCQCNTCHTLGGSTGRGFNCCWRRLAGHCFVKEGVNGWL